MESIQHSLYRSKTYFPTISQLQGSRQGDGTGPTIWAIISTNLLPITRDEGFDLDTISYLSQLTIVIAKFVFVNDTDIINATKLVNTRGEVLIKKQQRVIDTWASTLRATTRALQPYKSYWYMVDY